MKYRRKEIIEAVQWTGANQSEIKALAGQFALFDHEDTNHDGKTFNSVLKVRTTDSIIPAKTGDYVVRGTKGDFFIIAQVEFESIYEVIA